MDDAASHLAVGLRHSSTMGRKDDRLMGCAQRVIIDVIDLLTSAIE